jgi:uncharacterized protein YkwD
VLPRLLALVAALLLLVPATALAGMTRAEALVLGEMNHLRAEHGLPPLRYDPHLQRAARAHSHEMLMANVFQHGAFGTRLSEFDVQARVAGENIAWGTGFLGSPAKIVAAWFASPGHRANLLQRSFTRVGVGDLVGAFLGHADAHVVTADFAG